MNRIITYLVVTGAERRCAVTASNLFRIRGRMHLDSLETFRNNRAEYIVKILSATRVPDNWLSYYWHNLVHIASSLLNIRESPKRPILVAFTDDSWIDAPRDEPLTKILEPLLSDRRWKTFALRNGIVTCVFSHRGDYLRPNAARSWQRRLLNQGVDLIIDDRKQNAQAISLEVYRCFDLLVRQDRWATESRLSGWFDTLVAFCLFGLCQSLMGSLVGWILEKDKDTTARIASTVAAAVITLAVLSVLKLMRRTIQSARKAATVRFNYTKGMQHLPTHAEANAGAVRLSIARRDAPHIGTINDI